MTSSPVARAVHAWRGALALWRRASAFAKATADRSALRTAMSSLLVVLVLAVRSASAQSAAIEGRIVDEQALAVPGVAVTLTSPATGSTRQAVSDGQGAYRIAGLSPGVYNLRVALDGF